jgi:branched-chain amino acid transport system substrate-binding protein
MSRKTTDRRTLLKGAAAASALLPLPWAAARGQGQPIKIGLVGPLSGANQINGAPVRLGAEIVRDQVNAAGGIGGRPIELVVRDGKGDPNATVATFRELAGEGVRLVVGPVLTGENLAVVGVLQSLNIVNMACGSGEEKLTHDLYNPNFFTALENNFSSLRAFAAFMARRYPDVTTWTGIFPGVAVGESSWAGMAASLKEHYRSMAGKDITLIDPIVTKFGSTDFKTQIGQLQAGPAVGLHTVLFGADGITFFQQARQLGLEKKFKVISEQSLSTDLPKSLKQNMWDNVWSRSFWDPGAFRDVPESVALEKEVLKRTGDKFPHQLTSAGHTAMVAFVEALKATKGDTDPAKIIPALESVQLKTVKGPASFRKEDHQIMTSSSFFKAGPANTPDGFAITDSAKLNLAPYVNPPNPGKAFKMPNA